MIKTYDSMYLETQDGLIEQPNRKQLIIPVRDVDEQGFFHSFSMGKASLVNEGQTLVFIVDDNVANQAEKLKLNLTGLLPTLELKEGEIIEDSLSEEEKAILELEQELLIRKAQLNSF